MSGGGSMPPEMYLVGDRVASDWTGRPVGTIRRWGLEGRLTKYVIGPHKVRYDIRELTPWDSHNGPMKAPPKPQHAAAA